jgi:hypothetical protein
MTLHTILLVAADTAQREFIAGQLDADGHSATGAIAKLFTNATPLLWRCQLGGAAALSLGLGPRAANTQCAAFEARHVQGAERYRAIRL